MNDKKTFYNRLKYAPYKFEHQDAEVRAYRHKNPDGTLGGWVAETCDVADTVYIEPTAEVFEYATVKDNVRILHESRVCEFAEVSGSAVIDDYSMVCGNSKVNGNAYIGGNSIIAGDTKVGGYTEIFSEIKDGG